MKSPWMKNLFRSLALCALVTNAAQAADPYPNKPIRWIVPWPAGGVADTQARIIAQYLGAALGQPVLVDNRAGASGVLGADIAAKSKPDGYTLIYISPNEQAIAQAIGMKVPYNAEKDFTPITQFLRRPTVLVVNPLLNVRSVPDLVALAKAKGSSMSFGTGGVAHVNHFAAELFNRKVGISVTSVPYKGEAPMLTDLIGGQVAYAFGFATTLDPMVKAGRLRALATTGKRRSPQLPDVPTFNELGMQDLELYIWTGIAGPAGLPSNIVKRLQGEISKVLNSTAVKSRREFADSEIVASKPEDFRAHLITERVRWAKMVKETGITAE